MHINQILRRYATEDRHSHLFSLNETNLVRTNVKTENLNGKQLNVDGFNGGIPFNPAVLLAPIIFLTMAGAVIWYRLKLSHSVDKLNSSQKIPCQKCRFFSNNKYLKCTVHPSSVLTEEAINCRDYQPIKRKFLRFSRIYGTKVR
jgi:hypothetical protein